MRLRRLIVVTVLLLLGATLRAGEKGAEVYLKHLRYLASDELRGRGNDMPELEWAAEYIADRFADYGLLPAGDSGSYFQEFEVTTGLEHGPRTEVTLFGTPQNAVRLRLEKDYTPLTFGSQGEVIGPLVFAGYGISAPELGYDDYRNLDVRDKVVVIYEHEPQENSERSVFAGLDPTPYSTVLSKVLAARSRGAAAVILLPDTFNHYRSWERDRQKDVPLDDLGIQAIRLSDEWGARLMELSGRDPLEVRRWINRHLTPYSFDFVGVNAFIHLDVRRIRHKVRNVLGLIPGWGDETIVLGAHYDHLGLGVRSSLAPDEIGEIHNGADDNASGTAGLLQLAQEFGNRATPRRGVLFIAFAGEELGLVGSRHYVDSPLVPLEKTAAMLNMDMIGRSTGDLLIGGVGTAREFRPILESLARVSPLHFRYAETPGGSSDHQSFALKGIPVLFFFSGLHADYHRPGDDWQKIDIPASEEILDVVRGTLRRLEELPGPLHWQDLRGRLDLVDSGREAVYFGSVPDMSYEGDGVRFEQIRPDSPAVEAGVQAGDTLVELDGKPVGDLHDFTEVLQQRAPGDVVDIAVLRDAQLVHLQVTLGQRP